MYEATYRSSLEPLSLIQLPALNPFPHDPFELHYHHARHPTDIIPLRCWSCWFYWCVPLTTWLSFRIFARYVYFRNTERSNPPQNKKNQLGRVLAAGWRWTIFNAHSCWSGRILCAHTGGGKKGG